jgi:hypothetical protein
MSLERIISGGQTGADQGGLEAAAFLGIPTGGKMPKGFKTEDGYYPELAEKYDVEELVSGEYAPRTRYNVLDSDATVIFGILSSPGSRTTRQMCLDSKRPCLVVEEFNDFYLRLFNDFLNMYSVTTLNVAGNRESKNKGIQQKVYDFLIEALQDTLKEEHAGTLGTT